MLIDVLSIVLFMFCVMLFYEVTSRILKAVLFVVIVLLGSWYMLSEHLDIITSIGERLLGQ